MFRKKAAQRWQELRKGPLSEEQIKANFDEAMNELRPAAIRNYNRWKKVIAGGSRNVQEKWEREGNNLREWLIGRMEWLDSELSKYNIVTHQARG